MKQLTSEEAIALGESGEWKKWTMQQRAVFQMVQDCLCMPFSDFHEAVEKTLGRPVWTHEFGLNREGLQKELAGTQGAPSMDEIMGLIPAEKLLTVQV